MSALTLLSVVAPGAPSVPKGSSGEAVTGFQALLAAVSVATATGSKAPRAANAAPAELEVDVQAETEVPAEAGLGGVPVPLPTPPIPANDVTPADGQGDPAADAERTEPAEDADTVLVDGGPLAPGVPPAPGLDPATTAPAQGKGATSTASGPVVQQTLPDLVPAQSEPPAAEPIPAKAEAAAAAAAASAAATVTAALETGARNGTAPSPASPPPAVPATPLRPLADRLSRPLETSVASGDAPQAAEPVRASAAVAAVTPPAASGATTTPTDLAVAYAVPDMARKAEDDRAPLEARVPGETAPSHATAAPAETGGSRLARATVEATAQIAAQILRRLEGRSTRFEMALTPDELGRVDVKLDIDSQGRLNARLAFDNPAAATDLRGRADELRRQLEDAGFHLADDAFEFTGRDSGSSAFDRGGRDDRHGPSRAFASASRLNSEIDAAQPPRWLSLTLAPSGVDMKV